MGNDVQSKLTFFHSNSVTLCVEKSTDLRHVAVSLSDVLYRAGFHEKCVIISEHLCQTSVVAVRQYVISIRHHVIVHVFVRGVVRVLGMGIILSKNWIRMNGFKYRLPNIRFQFDLLVRNIVDTNDILCYIFFEDSDTIICMRVTKGLHSRL